MTLTNESLLPVAEPGAGGPAVVVGGKRRSLLGRLLRHPTGLPSIVFLLIVVVAVVAAPVLAPANPLTQNFTHVLTGPTAHNVLGTDQLGRDVLSRLLYGGRITLLGVVEAVAVALALGLSLGVLAGYVGGAIDAVLSRATEIIMSIPAIVLLLMVFTLFNNNEQLAMVTLGVLSAPTIFRVARAAALQVREEAYISSARITGVGPLRIMLRHVLPRIYGPVIVNTSILAALVLGIQGGLNFIGLGVAPPAPSWGGMIAEAQAALQQQSWLIVPTGGLIGLTILAFVLLGDALRDVTSDRVSSGHVGSGRPSTAQAPAPHQDFPVSPGPGSPLLAVRNLSVAFAGGGDTPLRVVQDVSFDVAPGEAIAIVGESGCGKSVTSAAILGLLGTGGSVVAGSAVFDGRDLFTLSRSERSKLRGRQIAFVSQEPMTSLDPCFTVGSQLGELVASHEKLSRPDRRKRVLELLGQVGLPDPEGVAKLYLHQISGGMAQRVSIAAALAGRPRLLVADEPTTALDVTVQAEILELLRTLQRDTGMAILIITHDLGVVADLCSRAIVMYAGEVVELGTVRDLVHAPTHPYTKALLASNPALGVEGEPLPTIAGTVPAPAARPVGCHFADRCEYRIAACTQAPVPVFLSGDERVSRCLRHDDLLAQATPSGPVGSSVSSSSVSSSSVSGS